jgi:alpha-glucosidase
MGKENSDYIYFGADNGNLDYYFIVGPCIKGVVRKYVSLTGKTPLPKKKMLGIHQSRWSYGRNKRVDQIIEGYEKNNIPLDVMHLDIDYMDNYKVFTYNNERFDLPNDTAKWKEKGIDIVTIIDPGVKAEDNYFIYEEGKANNLFATQNGQLYHNRVWPGKSAYPDFTKEETRNWWAKNQHIMTNYGVAGIWNDMNEPASFDGPLPDDVEFANDGRPTNHLEIHNVYGHLMAKATYEGLKDTTNERPFVITRACYAGSQKYTTFWTGDNQSLWIHLQIAIPMLCNMSLSGLSFIGTDIGGFGADVTKELLIRWAEVGAFFPLCRNHASMLTRDQEPFAFDQETIDCYKKALDYRAELIPYYYDLFYNGELTGDPVLKPLIYNYQNDFNTHNLNDEFLIGDSILVSPVLEQGKTKKLVYLPKGNWYNKDENKIYKGENYYVIDAPLHICPTFIKCGSVIPTYPLSLHVENKDEIIFNIYLDEFKEISYNHLYDDGKSFDYRNNIYTLYNISISNDTINIDPVINNYKLYNKITLRIYSDNNIQEIITTGNKQIIKF